MYTKPNVVNLHFIDRCNYSCRYCFVKKENKCLSLEQIKNIVDNIKKYFDENKLDGRINLVGGEIFLFDKLQEVIDYIYNKNIRVSIVTNGRLLTKEFICNNKGKLETIGISVDSLNRDTNLKIGRCCKGKVLSQECLISLCDYIKDNNIKLKINTCVSKFNLNEDLTKFILRVKPDRYKIFQMMIVKGVNDYAKSLEISREEFEKYCKKQSFLNPICENNDEMSNSYLMVDNRGLLCVDNNKNSVPIGDVLIEDFNDLILKTNLNMENFNKRYK